MARDSSVAGRIREASLRGAGLALAAALVTGCSAQKFVADRLGSAFAAGGAVWAEDDDPALVGAALPFALKTIESLVAASPRNPQLLLGACRGFASYAAGFVEPEAEALPASEFEPAQRLRARALRLHLRALGYCHRALEIRLPGAVRRLSSDPEAALARAQARDVELLYWTGASWGSAIALGLERADLSADFPAVRALFARALVLDASFDRGALHEAMISIEAIELLGGSAERARQHFERALALSSGRRASPHVTWARSVPVAQQRRREFREELERALAIDPEASPPDRLSNLLAQARARRLLERIDELFYDEEEE